MGEYYNPHKELLNICKTWLLKILMVGNMRLQENELKSTKNENLETTWEEHRKFLKYPWVL